MLCAAQWQVEQRTITLAKRGSHQRCEGGAVSVQDIFAFVLAAMLLDLPGSLRGRERQLWPCALTLNLTSSFASKIAGVTSPQKDARPLAGIESRSVS